MCVSICECLSVYVFISEFESLCTCVIYVLVCSCEFQCVSLGVSGYGL